MLGMAPVRARDTNYLGKEFQQDLIKVQQGTSIDRFLLIFFFPL